MSEQETCAACEVEEASGSTHGREHTCVSTAKSLAEPYRMTVGKTGVTAFRKGELWTNVPNETEWYSAEDYRLLTQEKDHFEELFRAAADDYTAAAQENERLQTSLFQQARENDAAREALKAENERLKAEKLRVVDAAEMLWVVLANVSGGAWEMQPQEWQEAAARWRDNYVEALKPGWPGSHRIEVGEAR